MADNIFINNMRTGINSDNIFVENLKSLFELDIICPYKNLKMIELCSNSNLRDHVKNSYF